MKGNKGNKGMEVINNYLRPFSSNLTGKLTLPTALDPVMDRFGSLSKPGPVTSRYFSFTSDNVSMKADGGGYAVQLL
jgi:hypothetical protein